ncbi:GntR family transcriptional regulator [Halodurantibacterium flavum]|uniref:GntR family transcriptional regulator n=1 Tax=Halodurantibacterium flavum TaxID=1382802 RepID=A0ABW4S1T9_9RHOB
MTTQSAYYEVVRQALKRNIDDGVLPPGTRLFAAAVADRLGVSRSPARRALEMLAAEGVIRRDQGRGYLVGDAPPQEVRTNLHLLDLDLPQTGPAPLVRAGWERILERVEADVLEAIPFGVCQISEAAMGAHFSVSRTVTREVLARLHERGLIVKDRASHWMAGPLSARMLDDLHEIRVLLEPAALRRSAARLAPAELAAMRARIEGDLDREDPLRPAAIARHEADLHETCLMRQPNQRLALALRGLQVSQIVNHLFATHVARHREQPMLLEHRLVLDHLIAGDAAGAAGALAHHLEADHQRTRARLKVLSVFAPPPPAPYLSRSL